MNTKPLPNPHPKGTPILKELRITFHEDGQVIVGGNIDDKPICFYMLEIAKDTVKVFDPEVPEPLSNVDGQRVSHVN